MTQRAGSEASVTDSDEREFTVVIPPEARERTQVMPTAQEPVRQLSQEPPATAEEPVRQRAEKTSRWARLGAALFWIVLGWWLFCAVRLGAAWFDLAYVDGGFRAIDTEAWTDLVRRATDQGREELVTAAALSVLATVILLASRGRRWLGAFAMVVAAGTIVTAVWHLAP